VVASGAAAHEAIGRISADAFFLGVTGIHPTAGLTTGDADEAAIKRAWSERSADTFVLGSGEKIGAASAFEVVPLAAVTAVLTDSAAPDREVEELRSAGVDVIRAA
jgi:DeoR/GlpR family transcriptional regulator of sugar metabolism